MFDPRLINQVLVWERKFEVEDEYQKYHRPEAYEYYPIALEPCPKEHKPILGRLIKLMSARNVTSTSSEITGTMNSSNFSEA